MERDPIGRITTTHLPDSTAAHYTYDPLSLRQVEYNGYVHTYDEYDLKGNLVHATLIGEAGELNTIYDVSSRKTTVNASHYSQTGIQYDTGDNLTQYEFADTLGSGTSHFTYDALHQVTSENGPKNHTYAYDSLNNRVQKDNTSYHVDAHNQLLKQGKVHYEYDLNGNLICENDGWDKTIYTYDALDRLVCISHGATRIFYSYDPFNRRIAKTEKKSWVFSSSDDPRKPVSWDSKTIYYLYQGTLEVGACNQGRIQELRILGYSPTADIGASVLIQLEGKAYAPIHDHLGNVVSLVDAKTGAVKETYRYTSYGEETTTGTLNPWRFSSKRKDDKLIYFGARNYNPSIGRWITPDPIGYGDGPNLYAYVHNAPLTHVDTTGLSGFKAALSGAFGIAPFILKNITPTLLRQYAQSCGATQTTVNGAKVYPWPDRESPQRSKTYKVSGKRQSNVGIGWVNGINNSEEDSKHSAKYIQDASGGYEVGGVYSYAPGAYGVFDATLNLCGIATTPYKKVHEMWDNYFDNASDDAVFLHFCHSMGAAVTENALKLYPKEKRDRIIVVAIAPYSYIDPRLCKEVTHYVVKGWDPIPHFDDVGCKKAKHTIRYLDSHKDARFHDHGFESPTYKKVIGAHCRDYLEKYG